MVLTKVDQDKGDIWLYHQFGPWGQFSRWNGGKTLFFNENPYFWLRIWKEREISRQKSPVGKMVVVALERKKMKVNCLRNDSMPFLWIILVFRGKQTFKILHKSRWNVKVYITLTIMTFRSIFKVTWRSRWFFIDWTLCPDKYFL